MRHSEPVGKLSPLFQARFPVRPQNLTRHRRRLACLVNVIRVLRPLLRCALLHDFDSALHSVDIELEKQLGNFVCKGLPACGLDARPDVAFCESVQLDECSAPVIGAFDRVAFEVMFITEIFLTFDIFNKFLRIWNALLSYLCGYGVCNLCFDLPVDFEVFE
jgi:hypothetical protein